MGKQTADMEARVRELVKANLPEVAVARVEVSEGRDSMSMPCLNLRVVMRQRPWGLGAPDGNGDKPGYGEFLKKSGEVERQFRTWLVTACRDNRFPYFRFESETDLRDFPLLEERTPGGSGPNSGGAKT